MAHRGPKRPPGMRSIMVTTLYGHDNKVPMVQLEVPGGMAQLGVAEAENLARNLVHAIEASITDAFLVEFFQQPEFSLGQDGAIIMLREFRQWREARIAKPPGGEWSTNAEGSRDQS